MQPLAYLQTTGGILWTAACVLLGFFLTWLAYFVMNRIPASWLCDYNETPSEELLSGKRVKYVGSGLVVSVIASVSLVLCRLQFNKGYDIYFVFFSLIIMVTLMIAVSDFKYTIIPDQFTAAVAVLGLMISVYDIIRGYGLLHTSWWSPLAGMGIGAGVMIFIDLIGMLIYKKEGMGFGDVKLFAAIGIMTGFPGTFYAFAISLVSAMICFGVIIIMVRVFSAGSDGKAEEFPVDDESGEAEESPLDDESGRTEKPDSEELQEEKDAGSAEDESAGEPENEAKAGNEEGDNNSEPDQAETPEEESYRNGGSYLAFGPYIAISLICYIVFYDFIHHIVNWYLGLF